MTTNNAVNNGLAGSTGTGSFVGSDSPTFTTNISTPNLQFTANTITATNSGGSINFQVSTTGVYNFKGTASTAAELRFFENTGNGSNYTGFKAAESVASNVTFTWPSADGTSGQAITTDGNKVLSFTTVGGGGTVTDWVAYTPTITALGTCTNVAFYSKRVGGSIVIRGTATSGTATGSDISFTLGYNGTDGNITTGSTIGAQIAITGVYLKEGTTNLGTCLMAAGDSVFYINRGGSSNFSKAAGTALGSTNIFSVFVDIPVDTWP